MALSDYLSESEWDACLYRILHNEPTDFGDIMHKTINSLLANKYKFQGLTEEGYKKEQIPGTRNPQKLVQFFLGEPKGILISEVLTSGRDFLKLNAPDLVEESDESWIEQMNHGLIEK
jgi:hypothetical protein